MTERPEPSNSVWTLSGKTKAKENPLQQEVDRLKAVLAELAPYVRDEDGDCVLCLDPVTYYRNNRIDRRHKPICPMVELGFLEVNDL